MRTLSRIILVLLTSIVIALLLATIPKWNRSDLLDPKSAIDDTQSMTVNSQTIVDRLSRMPLNLDIARVDWNEKNILSIDFRLPRSEVEPTEIIADVSKIALFSLVQTTNINHLLLRVLDFAQPEHNGRLLLAVNVGRKELSQEQLSRMKRGRSLSDVQWQSILHFTYTQRWKEKYEQFKN